MRYLTKEKIKKGAGFLKFDNDFYEIRISHIVIIYLITSAILLSVSIFMLTNSNGEIDGTNMNLLCLLSGILLSIMLIHKVKPSKKKINVLYKDFINKLNIKEIAWISLFLVCLNLGTSKLVINIIYVFSPSIANTFANDHSITINSTIDYWICFLLLAILSPIVDELTFRYVLFRRLTKKFNIYTGLIVSSILFAAINVCPNIIGTLMLGIINCILYVKYENILIPMFIYFVNNLIGMIAEVQLGRLKYRSINYNSHDIMVNSIAGAILFTIGIIFMIKFIIENKIYLKENTIKSKT